MLDISKHMQAWYGAFMVGCSQYSRYESTEFYTPRFGACKHKHHQEFKFSTQLRASCSVSDKKQAYPEWSLCEHAWFDLASGRGCWCWDDAQRFRQQPRTWREGVKTKQVSWGNSRPFSPQESHRTRPNWIANARQHLTQSDSDALKPNATCDWRALSYVSKKRSYGCARSFVWEHALIIISVYSTKTRLPTANKLRRPTERRENSRKGLWKKQPFEPNKNTVRRLS